MMDPDVYGKPSQILRRSIALVLVVFIALILLALSDGHNRLLAGRLVQEPTTEYGSTLALNHPSLDSVSAQCDKATGAQLPHDAADGAVATGPLRASEENGRYFADGTGKLVYLSGSHTWLNVQDGGPTNSPGLFDYSQYLDFLVAHNHNFTRLWTWEQFRWVVEWPEPYTFSPHPYLRTGPGLASDGKPRFDLSSLNQAYFDRLRERVVQAGNRGVYVSIMLFNGWSTSYPKGQYDSANPWLGHPYHRDNNINSVDGDPNRDNSGLETHRLELPTVTALQEQYVKKVVDSVNDLDNVLYEISNESDGGSYSWQYHFIDFIKAYEKGKPKQHPVGMTVEWPGGSNSILMASNADWVSPNGDINNPVVADGSKVILGDTDHFCGICGDRAWVWKAFTRGMNPMFMDQYDDGYKLEGGGYDPHNLNDVSLRQNLGYTRLFAERMDLLAMTPRVDLASSGYCLANPLGAEYLVYLPSSGEVNVDLRGSNDRMIVEWFNPANGDATTAGTVDGGWYQSFTPPFVGDAVLYLHGSASGPLEPASWLPLVLR